MSNQTTEPSRFACPNCGEGYEPPVPDHIHTIATLTQPSDLTTFVEAFYECLNCHHSIRLYWLEGNRAETSKKLVSPRTDALRAHRWRLNENLFKWLQTLEGSSANYNTPWDELMYHFDLSKIRADPYFGDGLKHLSIDIPPYPMELTLLENNANKLNRRITRYRESVRLSIEAQLSAIAPCTRRFIPDNAIYLPNVLTIIESHWFLGVNRYLLGRKNIDTIIRELETLYEPRRTPEGELWLTNLGVAKLPLEKDAELLREINTLAHDKRFVRRILRYTKEKKLLELRAKGLSELIGRKVVHPIEDEQYSTFAECCKRVLEAAGNEGTRQ